MVDLTSFNWTPASPKAGRRPLDIAFQNALGGFPAPGVGAGCHGHILRAASLGIMAGRLPELIFDEIREAIPVGGRRVADREIWDAVHKAASDCLPVDDSEWPPGYESHGRRREDRDRLERENEEPAAEIRAALDYIPLAEPARLRERSPVQWSEATNEAGLLLNTLYGTGDLVWTGGLYGKHPARLPEALITDWQLAPIPNYIVPNPLLNEMRETSSGTMSYRCDRAVAAFRFAVLEFDAWPIRTQVGRLLYALDRGWRIAAVIHSGGKSLHCWIRVAVSSLDEWRHVVRDRLFPQRIEPLGGDRATSNPSRLSRLPGAIRTHRDGQKTRQSLLYLNPDA